MRQRIVCIPFAHRDKGREWIVSNKSGTSAKLGDSGKHAPSKNVNLMCELCVSLMEAKRKVGTGLWGLYDAGCSVKGVSYRV